MIILGNAKLTLPAGMCQGNIKDFSTNLSQAQLTV